MIIVSIEEADSTILVRFFFSRATRLPKVGSCDTPSYLRHYARFHDHNYQPNVNIMDLEDDAISVANSPAPLSSTSNLGGNITPGIPSTAITPTLPRFGSNIQGGPSLGDNNNGTRVSLSGGTAASGPSCSNNETDRICSNAINSHSFNHPIQSKLNYTCDKQVLWESAGAFFPRDNSLISRGNSHVSRVRGLVLRCLLFNPEVSCSNPWVCANFFTSIPKQTVLTFFGTMRLGFVRLFSAL